ncbi:MAG: ATP-dependent DNA helicase RecQ, partial [Gallionella sp.]|nr:ATP-dependent DNA helicase RecQ [Gallionella sp.]
QVERHDHHRQSTFAIGKAWDATQWSSVFRQLIASGFLTVDIAAYGGLQLTAAARPVLRGEQAVWLRRDVQVAKHKRGTRSAKPTPTGVQDDGLWPALKAKRMELAREQGVPPYVIFHDSTLVEMMSLQPRTLDEMARVSGIGQAKLARYGDAFLKVFEDAVNRV